VTEITETQQHVTTTLAIKDGPRRAEDLKLYVYSDIFPVRQFAVEQLGSSGPPAVPSILDLVDDPQVRYDASQLVEILVKAGGSGVGQDMADRLSEELGFWKSAAASLQQGWWDSDPSVYAPLRQHYGKTLQLVVAVRTIRYLPSLGTVVELRDFWRSRPQLDDPSGLDQMVTECERTIASFRKN
jgi:hypothetical protein